MKDTYQVKTETVFGLFSSQKTAQKVVKELEKNGVGDTNISAIAKENFNGQSLTGSKGGSTTPSSDSFGPVSGAVVGGLGGLIGGLLISLAVQWNGFLSGSFADQFFGFFTLAVLLLGTISIGTVLGYQLGEFLSLEFSGHLSRIYGEKIKGGAMMLVVSVQTPQESKKVKSIFSSHKGKYIESIQY